MLDFRRKVRQTPSYLDRREQRKLLLLVVTAGLVIFLMTKASDPNFLPRMFEFFAPPVAGGGGGVAAKRAADRPGKKGGEPPIDTKLKRAQRAELGPDEFIARAEPLEELPQGKHFFPGVRAEFLAHVEDDTPFRAREVDAYYHLLKVLAESDPKEIEKASGGPVTYTQIFTQPKVYRGELVTFKGEVRSAEARQPPSNAYGITTYYKTCIKPADRDELVLAYFLELDDDFPLGEQVHVPVEFTGFFYKRMPYGAGDGIRIAPLLLARNVTRRLPTVVEGPPAPEPFDPTGLIGALIGAAMFSLAVIWFVLARTRRGGVAMKAGHSGGGFRLGTAEAALSDETIRKQLRQLAQSHDE
ncbi:MAG TPA: hypothetical protein VND64_22990 [Pirellulales bacterium]|nr:hypothetical protein [Pirellulales bacterium]